MIDNIKKMIAKELDINPSKIKDNSDIMEEFGLDSLALMNIVAQIEEEFNYTFDDESILTIKTPQDVVDAIKK